MEQPPRTVRVGEQMGHSNKGPANSVPGQQERAAWGTAARADEGRWRKPTADMLSSYDLNTTQG